MHSEAVSQGQWWRAVTALTLHGGLQHILSNSLFGSLFGFFVARYLGSGVGWLTILGCATLANLLNAYVHPDDFELWVRPQPTSRLLDWPRPCSGEKALSGNKTGDAIWRRSLRRSPCWSLPDLARNGDVGGHLAGFAFGVIAGLQLSRVTLRPSPYSVSNKAAFSPLPLLFCVGF